MKRNITADIALAGILTAVTVILLILSSLLPTARVAAFVICAFPVYLPLTRKKFKLAIVIALASSVLSLLIVPNKLYILPYPCFVAPFAIIQVALKDKVFKWLEYLIKYLFFNIVCVAFYFIFNAFVDMTAIMNAFNVSKTIAIIILWLLLNIVFFLYDYATRIILPKLAHIYDRIDKNNKSDNTNSPNNTNGTDDTNKTPHD